MLPYKIKEKGHIGSVLLFFLYQIIFFILQGAAAKSRHWPYLMRTVIDMALKFYKNGAVWTRTADEFFFRGFNDEIVNLLAVLPASLRYNLGVFMPWDRIGYTYAVSR